MASNDLAKLIVRLEAQTADYQRDLDKATRKLDKFSKDAGGALKRIDQAGRAIGNAFSFAFAGLSLAALSGTVKRILDLGEELNNASIKSGIAAESFTQLAYAAKLAGVDTGSLSSAISKMQRALSEARTGGKEQAEALAALGLSIKDLIALSPDRQFELLADRINELRDPADRARAAVALFGKAGADLLPLFEQGAAGIRAAREEAQKIGQSFSQEQLKALDDAGDSVQRLGASFEALAVTLVAKVAPALERVFNRITEVISGGEIVKLKKEIAELEASQNGAGLYGAGEFSTSLPGPDFSREIAERKKRLFALQLQEFTVTSTRMGAGSAPGFRPAAPKGSGRSARDEIPAGARNFFEIPSGGLLPIDPEKLVATRFDQFGDELKRSVDALAEDISDELDKAFEPQVDAMSVYAEQAARNMQDAFARFLFDPFKDGLGGMLRAFADTIRQMVAQAVAADLFNRIGGWAKGAAGGGGILGTIGSVIGAIIPGRAMGGPVSAGNPYLVGERGPELFVPRHSGAIVPNGGAAPMVFNFAISAPTGSIDRRTQMQVAAEVRRVVDRGGRNA